MSPLDQRTGSGSVPHHHEFDEMQAYFEDLFPVFWMRNATKYY